MKRAWVNVNDVHARDVNVKAVARLTEDGQEVEIISSREIVDFRFRIAD